MASASCSPQKVVVVNVLDIQAGNWADDWERWDAFVGRGKEKKLGRDESGTILWKRMGFNWPLWILFSSGTTGE